MLMHVIDIVLWKKALLIVSDFWQQHLLLAVGQLFSQGTSHTQHQAAPALVSSIALSMNAARG